MRPVVRMWILCVSMCVKIEQFNFSAIIHQPCQTESVLSKLSILRGGSSSNKADMEMRLSVSYANHTLALVMV